MSGRNIDFYRDFLSKTMSAASKFEFNSDDDAILHIFTLLSSSIELLDNMYVLALNESKIGIPILLRSILEASVDIQFILINKDNYKRIEIENILLWKGIVECAYKDNEYLKNIRNRPEFKKESKENSDKLKSLKNNNIIKADISTKFENTIYADAYNSIYAVLCSHSHNGVSAQNERHITIENGKSRVNMFKETSIEEYDHYLFMAVFFVFYSIYSINEAFKYKFDNEINDLRLMLSRIALIPPRQLNELS